MVAEELDYVLTRTGRKGTIVLVHGAHEAYEIEYYDDGEWELETILPTDIAEIIVAY
ncbi:hypothetical protein [Fontibacillus sp. BL9]|uniref:hypothetical protein n=1 Tax=Fontibacillus sp. BL9 TaxID=3389971 RepID=UPI00397C27A7